MRPVFLAAEFDLKTADDLELVAGFEKSQRAAFFLVDVHHVVGCNHATLPEVTPGSFVDGLAGLPVHAHPFAPVALLIHVEP